MDLRVSGPVRASSTVAGRRTVLPPPAGYAAVGRHVRPLACRRLGVPLAGSPSVDLRALCPPPWCETSAAPATLTPPAVAPIGGLWSPSIWSL